MSWIQPSTYGMKEPLGRQKGTCESAQEGALGSRSCRPFSVTWCPVCEEGQQGMRPQQIRAARERTTRGIYCGSVVKKPPAKQEMWLLSLGLEDPLEKEMATHSSILARESP